MYYDYFMKKEEFIDRGNCTMLWLARSKEFYDGSKTLWSTDIILYKNIRGDICEGVHPMYRFANLLMGLCLETLLKGLLIQKNIIQFSSGKIPNDLKGHDLKKLLTQLNINLSSEEELLVGRLTDDVIWVSKYPVPIFSDHLNIDKLIRQEDIFIIFENLRIKIILNFNRNPHLNRYLI